MIVTYNVRDFPGRPSRRLACAPCAPRRLPHGGRRRRPRRRGRSSRSRGALRALWRKRSRGHAPTCSAGSPSSSNRPWGWGDEAVRTETIAGHACSLAASVGWGPLRSWEAFSHRVVQAMSVTQLWSGMNGGGEARSGWRYSTREWIALQTVTPKSIRNLFCPSVSLALSSSDSLLECLKHWSLFLRLLTVSPSTSPSITFE